MSVEMWAERIAIKIKQANEEETSSVAVMKFALIIVINFLMTLTLALGIGAATGKFAGTALAFAAFVLLRAVSGGHHFQSPIVCTIVTAAMTALPPHIRLPDILIVTLTVIALTLVALFAHSNIRGYIRMPEKYFPLLKIISVLIVSSNFFVQSPILAQVFHPRGYSIGTKGGVGHGQVNSESRIGHSG